MLYVFSCPTCLVPFVLSCLVPCIISCPMCLVPYMLSCFAYLVPFVLSCLAPRATHALVPHVPRSLRALGPRALHTLVLYMPRALRAFFPYVPQPNVLLCFTCLTCCCTSRILCLAHSGAARASNSMYPCAPRPSLASGVSSLTCSYASHSCSFYALCLLYFRCFSYLRFLQSGLRLIIVIDSNKDTLNINNINTLYPLRVATYVKNEFQNLQKGIKSNRRGLGYF